ncbi:YbhB/YbcL family Raf kinase inhibitor-like protein [Candidatus Thorarchaeota archaeon]|nr:MAG: YbhB/YbcL family Raf kinase inhibitor-like protein [Candidatus Thorarchaeota archaeon]
MELRSNDFNDSETIPDKCAYRKGNEIPHLAWDNVPAKAKSLALLCHDPDAPAGDWIHWMVHSIDPDVTEIPSGGPVPGVELENDFGEVGWGGPAPPSGTHRYFFKLYALDIPELKFVAKDNFTEKCENHKIEVGELMGTYTKH